MNKQIIVFPLKDKDGITIINTFQKKKKKNKKLVNLIGNQKNIGR